MGRRRLLDPRVGRQVQCVCLVLLVCWLAGSGGHAACFGPLQPACRGLCCCLLVGVLGASPASYGIAPLSCGGLAASQQPAGSISVGVCVAVLCLVGLATGLPGLRRVWGLPVFFCADPRVSCVVRGGGGACLCAAPLVG
jgi:hypothetical protein